MKTTNLKVIHQKLNWKHAEHCVAAVKATDLKETHFDTRRAWCDSSDEDYAAVEVSIDGCFSKAKRDADLVAVLKACAKQKDLGTGSKIHADILRRGSLKIHHFLGSTLVNMYAKCGVLVKAQQVFDELPLRDVVSWTALITGYAQHGHGKEALNCFERMQSEGLFANAITFACLLKACADTGAAEQGKSLHAEIMRKGLLGNDIVLGNALMDMYFKSGVLSKAREVFNELPYHDVVSWNALIAGYAQNGRGDEALDCFEQMQQEGIFPDAVTLLSILPACGSIGASDKGKKVHADIIKEGLLGKDCVLGTALVDMYAKCGSLSKAQRVFNELPVRDVVLWNALITGYAEAGKHEIVFELFRKMIGEGTKPTLVTFIVVLTACSYLGLVDEGQMYYEIMHTRYGIIPTFEHHTCMVDLFGRAGHFEKAMEVIQKMPSSDYRPTWFALLGACRKWGNVTVGRLAFKHAVRLEKKSAVVYVYMSDIYAAAGMREDAEKIEAMRLENEAWV